MSSLETMNFEEALRELETIVRRLEEGKVSLDEAINAYERGAALRAHCEKKLKDARLRIEHIVVNADGTIKTQPANLEE
ncbi:MAG: exodeoxyribonuclease VII small subunit [Proteobacteria bacterium]|nr:exodeoxyribonuclease VII small subunit [Pseudomonadota bacterium]